MEQYTIHSLEDLRRVMHASESVTDRRLGEILVEEGRIDEEQLRHALAVQARQGRHLGEVLLDLGLVSREHLNGALAQKLSIPYVRLGDFTIHPAVLELVAPDIALQYSVLPLAEFDKRLVVAMENPLDLEALEVLHFRTNRAVEPVITSGDEIARTLARYYRQHPETEIDNSLDELEVEPVNEKDTAAAFESLEHEASKKPIVRLVNAIITQGIDHHASDINIRPEKDKVNIYYRIDGKLRFSRSFSRALLAPLVSRIKITGRMNIAERRLPQDGHLRVLRGGESIDLRISTIPTVTGESVVIRILDKRVGLRSLDALGLQPEQVKELRRLCARNHGIFLVTGPTGCGKSTTLYALLNEVKERNPHIITVEDPVEYDMAGVEQIQTSPTIGYTFAEALRHMLRHDPDVIMIGEMRDLETASIAARAALTGHLVFSTLHTNDSAGSITRMIDMGLERYLVSSTLLGAMAQRLLRLNCPNCSEADAPTEEARELLGLDANDVFQRGRGCPDCHHTGYHGRIPVCELLTVTPELVELIRSGADSRTIREHAVEGGMRTLTENALALAHEGHTSLEEVLAARLE